jgi:hypothetical protein
LFTCLCLCLCTSAVDPVGTANRIAWPCNQPGGPKTWGGCWHSIWQLLCLLDRLLPLLTTSADVPWACARGLRGATRGPSKC